MKKYIARILTAAMLLSLLAVNAFAADGYGSYSIADSDGKEFTFTAAKAEEKEISIAMVESEAQTVKALVITLQPGSSITYAGEYTLLTAYNHSDDKYVALDGIRPEFSGTAKVDDLFGKKENWTVPVDMLSFYTTFDSQTGKSTEAYLVLGDGSEGQQPQAPAFTDVAADAYYAAPVAWAIEKGVTTGTSETTFSPNSTCTTAQILTFLWRANGSPAPTAESPFTDVAADVYYADAAAWAAEKGLVSGTTFGGDTPCTRSATVTYLWKLAGSPEAEKVDFTDVAADSDYAQAVAWAVAEEITTGTSETTFSPDSTCTRGQIVTFLYRDLAEAK